MRKPKKPSSPPVPAFWPSWPASAPAFPLPRSHRHVGPSCQCHTYLARRPSPSLHSGAALLVPWPVARSRVCVAVRWALLASFPLPSFKRSPAWTTRTHAETAMPTSPLEPNRRLDPLLKSPHAPTSPLPHSFCPCTLT
jgi:hypothetical protein